MNCNVEELFQIVPQLRPYYNKGKINIRALPAALQVKAFDWIDKKNNLALELGFNEKLYPVLFEKGENNIEERNLIINTEVIDRYLTFLEDVVKPEMMMERQLREDFIDNFIDDTILSNDALEAQEIEYTEGIGEDNYFSPIVSPTPSPTIDLNLEPVNFSEWLNIRKKLLSTLKAQVFRMTRLKQDKSQVNKLIETIEHEISNFDPEAVENIHHTLLTEIRVLNSALDIAIDPKTDSKKSAEIIENNHIKKRLDDLQFLLFDKEASEEFYYSFRNGLRPEDVSKILASLADTQKKYDSALEGLIYNIILDNEIVSQNTAELQSKGEEERIEEFKKRIRDILDPDNTLPENQLDGDKALGKMLLGASSYDNLIAELVVIARDINKNKEAGVTAQWKNNLKTSYDKIKNLKVEGEYLIDLLTQKDEFGLSQNKLVSYFGPKFDPDKRRKLNDSLRRAFMFSRGANRVSEYKNWMQTLGERSDFIEVQRIASFVKEYENNPTFNSYFTYTQEEMAEYEADMRSKMGNIAFEIELENQKEKIAAYLTDSFDSPRDARQRHPLAFLEHFYSNDYTGADANGDFLMPFYLHEIPSVNQEKNYSDLIKDLESRNIDGLKEYYTNAKKLIDYTRETALNEGLNMEQNHILNIEDNLNREVLKDLSLTGKARRFIAEFLRELFKEFRVVNLENPDSDDNYKRKFRSHFSEYGKRIEEETTELLSKKPLSELREIAEKEGLKIPMKLNVAKKTPNERIARAIARNRVIKSSSLDMHKRIVAGADIAESVNTRRSVSSILSLVKDYAKVNSLDTTKDFMKDWEVNNIMQVGFTYSNQYSGLSKLERFKLLGNKKIYSELEKELKQLYEEEMQNTEDTLNFTTRDEEGNKITYITKTNAKGAIFYLKKTPDDKTVKIHKSEIVAAHNLHIQRRLDALGTSFRVGNLLNGLTWNMFKAYLWLSPVSGIKNRLAGYNQNNQGAVSGLNGYNMTNLIQARKLLRGYNIRRYFRNLSKKAGIDTSRRMQQIGIVEHLADKLKLLDNVAHDIASGDGYLSNVGSRLEGTKNFLSDFAVNNPEFHNQMELLVAMMQQVEITKIDGTVETLFNTETQSFPFDPVTMKLLPEYRTESNIANWEEFKADEKGLAPQNFLIQRYKSVKDKLHGNYRYDDKIAMQSTISGKSAISFLKWLFENTANQYGSKKVSLSTMKLDVKGRKIPLLQRFPVLGAHLMMQNISWLGIATSISTFSGIGIPFVPALSGAVSLGMIGYLAFKNKANIVYSKNDFMLAGNYLTEVLARSISTTVSSLSLGKVNISQDYIDKISGIREEVLHSRNTDLETRRLISESAQEVADKFSMMFHFTVAGLTLKALAILSTAGLSDEEKEKQLDNLEVYFNYLINTRDSLTEEMEKWTSLSTMIDSHSQIILYRYISDTLNKTQKAFEKYEVGDISGGKLAYQTIESISDLIIGAPRQLLRLGDESYTMFGHNRVYSPGGVNLVDNFMKKGHKSPEAKYQDVVRRETKKLRRELTPLYRKKVRAILEEQGKNMIMLDEFTDKAVTKRLRDLGVYKTNKNTYRGIAETTNWRGIVEATKRDLQK